jgi:hypothetical protein
LNMFTFHIRNHHPNVGLKFTPQLWYHTNLQTLYGCSTSLAWMVCREMQTSGNNLNNSQIFVF